MKRSRYYDALLSEHLKLGQKQKFAGKSTLPFATFVASVARIKSARTAFDFGSGVGAKVQNLEHIGHSEINSKLDFKLAFADYEPAVNKLGENINDQPAETSQIYDLGLSFDVYEHLFYPDALQEIGALFDKSKCVIVNISCIPAVKILPNGLNAHTSLISPEAWSMIFWRESLRTSKKFCLFTTVKRHTYNLIHNFDYDDACIFEDNLFGFDNPDIEVIAGVKTNEDLSTAPKISGTMNGLERFILSHINTLYKLKIDP